MILHIRYLAALWYEVPSSNEAEWREGKGFVRFVCAIDGEIVQEDSKLQWGLEGFTRLSISWFL